LVSVGLKSTNFVFGIAFRKKEKKLFHKKKNSKQKIPKWGEVKKSMGEQKMEDIKIDKINQIFSNLVCLQ
jgi:hypothetical protein